MIDTSVTSPGLIQATQINDRNVFLIAIAYYNVDETPFYIYAHLGKVGPLLPGGSSSVSLRPL